MIINYKVFIITFFIGLLFVYLLGTNTKIIYIYPTPDNHSQFSVKDKSNTCFSYKPVKTKCPSEKSKISSYPFQ
jgi:hypothetical protein